jgi:hypothetical protein
LRLDSREAILKGGSSGPAIVPGKPDESLLVQALEASSTRWEDHPSRRAEFSPRGPLAGKPAPALGLDRTLNDSRSSRSSLWGADHLSRSEPLFPYLDRSLESFNDRDLTGLTAIVT